MEFLNQLNPEQREAVLRVEGPLLILAGADPDQIVEQVDDVRAVVQASRYGTHDIQRTR